MLGPINKSAYVIFRTNVDIFVPILCVIQDFLQLDWAKLQQTATFNVLCAMYDDTTMHKNTLYNTQLINGILYFENDSQL